jgi:hypothetical protein
MMAVAFYCTGRAAQVFENQVRLNALVLTSMRLMMFLAF